MYRIIEKKMLNPTVCQMEIAAPLVAEKALPGQFVILRPGPQGERIPLTIADYNAAAGVVTVIFQLVGAATIQLNALKAGDFLQDFAGPLGRPSSLSGLSRVAVVGGGVGCAIAYPIAKYLHNSGAQVHSVVGFRQRDLVILENEFRAVSSRYIIVTDDGSYGEKGLVTGGLERLVEEGNRYDRVIAIGPLVMMKFVAALAKRYGLKSVVSMNPIMVDGTGMCGCCRLTVGGKVRFACVDGPEFEGDLVDFDEAIARAGVYRDFERSAREAACRLPGMSG